MRICIPFALAGGAAPIQIIVVTKIVIYLSKNHLPIEPLKPSPNVRVKLLQSNKLTFFIFKITISKQKLPNNYEMKF